MPPAAPGSMAGNPISEGLGEGRSSAALSLMSGQEEGIYASSTSADVEIQDMDHGLTLLPKISATNDLLPFDPTDWDSWAGADDGSGDIVPSSEDAAFNQAWLEMWLVYENPEVSDAPAAKKRRLDTNLNEESSVQKHGAHVGTNPQPVSTSPFNMIRSLLNAFRSDLQKLHSQMLFRRLQVTSNWITGARFFSQTAWWYHYWTKIYQQRSMTIKKP